MEELNAILDPSSLEIVLTVLVKMGIGVLLAGAIGWERESQGRPAGVRTHMLMVLGVILFAEASKAFAQGDPTRIAAQIVTGVGFLGAGTIMRAGPEIKGLTTAASLWAAAGIGMAVSTGGAFLLIAIAATILALFTLTVVNKIERYFRKTSHAQEMIVTLESRAALSRLLAELDREDIPVDSVRVMESDDVVKAALEVEALRTTALDVASNVPGVLKALWSD